MRTVCVAAEPRALWSQNPSRRTSRASSSADAGSSASVGEKEMWRLVGLLALARPFPPPRPFIGLGEYGLHSFNATLVHSSWPPHAA